MKTYFIEPASKDDIPALAELEAACKLAECQEDPPYLTLS